MEYDYKALGLKCGLECHQQLDTGKLFSRTPSALREDKPHFKVKRRLRPVVSELGEHDRAALEAFEKGLHYIYEGYRDTVSLVELDEEPPQDVDREALGAVLEVALMCGCNILDEMFVMRKNVIDGSNTSGFQRTMLVATGGMVNAKQKGIGIQTLVLEEDSARPMERTNENITYRLDRLGIALIELATEPTIASPEEAKEVARAIGNVFRLTGKARRGLGSIRQDLNVSIRGGARVEIKGVQELELIDEYVRREVGRQLRLLELKQELAGRGVTKTALYSEPKNITHVFKSTESKILKNSLAKGESIFGIRLEKFSGLAGFEIQPGRRVGTEFADQVKKRAGLRGIFHSDEMPNYGINEKEIIEMETELGCSKDDAFVIVAGQKEKALSALRAVCERAVQCLDGVPEETRGALEDGNTEYLRPLPGAARMYPETDLETIVADTNLLQKIRQSLPRSLEEREKLYAKWGLNEKHIDEMKLSNYAKLFEKAVMGGADAKKTAVFLLEGLVEARRELEAPAAAKQEGATARNLDAKALEEFISAINSGKVAKEIQKELIIEKCKNPGLGIDQLLARKGTQSAGKSAVSQVVAQVIERNSALIKAEGERAFSALMGDAMKELRGRASGKEISDALRKGLAKKV